MRNEAITLVFAMGIGSVLMAACDSPEQQRATPASLGQPARIASATQPLTGAQCEAIIDRLERPAGIRVVEFNPINPPQGQPMDREYAESKK